MSFDGDIFFFFFFLVKGKITGSINSAGDLYIGENAYVEAQIKAGSVYVQGRVKGDIFAEKRVEVASSAIVEGNIITPEIVLERGCKLNGDCRMPEEDEVPGE